MQPITMNYRAITPEEIAAMQRNGCRASDWNNVKVKDGFNPECYVRVSFSGDIYLGVTDEPVIGTAGFIAQSGIYDATLQNCSVGDNVHISHVAECIMNYSIGNHAYISNVGSVICTGSRSFGNGTVVNVLDETGGRSVPIYDGLTAQIAYLIAMYRHNLPLVDRLKEMVTAYAATKKKATGFIGKYAKLTNVGSVTDVNFERESYANGTSLLWDGTVGQKAFVGPDVIAEHFILASEARLDKSAIVKNVFIGQASTVSNGFVAHDSLIFSNCTLECGEAAAIFAGPHTVSMHKSTLLIGGMFSFFNAGSGTNQSNHLYKTGPVHQGIMARGSKTGSNTYVMWPARFGYFSLITGSHYSHPDTSDLPYSYVVADGKDTLVIPGANLPTAGTIRDIMKWEDRDARSKDLPRLDIINYNALNPVTTSLMYNAINFLNEYERTPEIAATRNITLKDSAVGRGRQMYALGVDYFMGTAVVKKVLSLKLDKNIPLSQQLKPEVTADVSEWIDMAGMIVPKSEVERICGLVIDGGITSLDKLAEALSEVSSRYYKLTWNFVVDNFNNCYSQPIEDVSAQDLEAIIQRWTETVSALDRMRKADALKDFSAKAMTGYGIDGDRECQRADFDAVHGEADDSAPVQAIHTHYAEAIQNGFAAVRHLEKLIKLTQETKS